MTNDKTVSELIGETAAHRDRAIAEAEEKKRAMWARIPRLAEVDGVKCHAIFNPFVGRYFVDDVYGIIRTPPDRDAR